MTVGHNLLANEPVLAPGVAQFGLAPGHVYGTLLNFKGALAALGEAVNQAPYKAPPKAPILYIKPANTWSVAGAAIALPAQVEGLQTGGTLGVVIGRDVSHVDKARALECVLGYTVVNDVCLPHASVYRPSVRFRSRDGYCPIGSVLVPRAQVPNPDALNIKVFINDKLAQENTTANTVRSVAQLLVDVSEFMTLHAGDVLLVGVPEGAPLAKVGDRVKVEIAGVGSLENFVVRETEVAA